MYQTGETLVRPKRKIALFIASHLPYYYYLGVHLK